MKTATQLTLALCFGALVSCEKSSPQKQTTAPAEPSAPAADTAPATVTPAPAANPGTPKETPRSVATPAESPAAPAPTPADSPAPPAVKAVTPAVAETPASTPEPVKPTPQTQPDKPMPPSERFKDQIAKLTDIQRHVTQESGTERPFTGQYWDHKEPGIYVDIVSGKPLFSSLDKFDSGCGWPSFSKTLVKDEVKELVDTTHNMVRTEVRSATADSHLGHVFDDGPKELGGLRYCINSASIRFVPVADLEKEGLGEYKKLFEKKAEPRP